MVRRPGRLQIALLQGIPFDSFGYYAKQLEKHQAVIISTLDDLPPDAVGEKAWIEEHGFRSLLFIPLLWEGNLQGAMGFYGEAGKNILWSRLLIDLLGVISGILMNTFNRKKDKQTLDSKLKDLETFNKIAIGREFQMIALKKEVNALAKEAGRDAPYDLSFVD